MKKIYIVCSDSCLHNIWWHFAAGKGLGLSIVGRRNDTGVFISDIVKGGVAEADGRLQQGDQILSVNGEDMKQATQEQAAAMLKVSDPSQHGRRYPTWPPKYRKASQFIRK